LKDKKKKYCYNSKKKKKIKTINMKIILKLVFNLIILQCFNNIFSIRKNDSHGLSVQATSKIKVNDSRKPVNVVERNEDQSDDLLQDIQDLNEEFENCSKKIVGYYTEWTSYVLPPSDIAYDKLTHINYGI